MRGGIQKIFINGKKAGYETVERRRNERIYSDDVGHC